MKSTNFRRALSAALVTLALGAFADLAHAQSYPTRPIRFIVPFPAGGVADVTARLIGQRLGEALGQNIIDRKPYRRERHARRRCGDQGDAGRLHAPVHHRRFHHHADADAEGEFRSVQGSHPDRPGRDRAAAAGRACRRQHRIGPGTDRAGQGQPGQDRLFVAGQRHHQSARGGMARHRSQSSNSCTCPIAAARRPRSRSRPATCRSAR